MHTAGEQSEAMVRLPTEVCQQRTGRPCPHSSTESTKILPKVNDIRRSKQNEIELNRNEQENELDI